MTGLVPLAALAVWLVVSIWLARLATVRIRSKVVRASLFVTLAVLFVVAPLVDEVVGKYQFERYCENAREVKIYGAIPVGQELYTTDGKWRLRVRPTPREDLVHLNKIAESMILWDRGPLTPTKVPGAIPIHERQEKLYDARTGRLLAEYKIYSNNGGWLKRTVGTGAAIGGFIVPQQCFPSVVHENRLIETLLPYSGRVESGR